MTQQIMRSSGWKFQSKGKSSMLINYTGGHNTDTLEPATIAKLTEQVRDTLHLFPFPYCSPITFPSQRFGSLRLLFSRSFTCQRNTILRVHLLRARAVIRYFTHLFWWANVQKVHQQLFPYHNEEDKCGRFPSLYFLFLEQLNLIFHLPVVFQKSRSLEGAKGQEVGRFHWASSLSSLLIPLLFFVFAKVG